MPQGRHRRSLGPAADATLVGAVVMAPLALGAVHLETQLALLVLAAAGSLLVALHGRQRGGTIHLPALALFPLCLLASSVWQLVPLPRELLELLSPHAHDILSTSLDPLEGYRWHPLSLDPPATAVELGKLVTYLLLFVAAYQRGRESHGGRRLLRWVALGGVAVLLVTALQTIAGVRSAYGVFGAKQGGFLVTSFVNSNHAAGYFGAAAFVAAGLALGHRDRARGMLWGLAAITLAAAVPLTLSRGGMLALAATLLFGGGLLYTRGARNRLRGWLLQIGVAAALAIAVLLAYRPIANELATIVPGRFEVEKTFLWGEALRMTPSFWLTGVGRGAFGRVFPVFKSAPHSGTFNYVENEPIQLLVDHGLLAGALLLAGLVCFFAFAVRNAWNERRIGATCALFFVGVHNLVDFDLEIPAVAAAVILIAVAVTNRRPRRSAWSQEQPAPVVASEPEARRPVRFVWRIDPRAVAVASVLVAAVGIGALVWGHRHDGRDLDAALAATRDPVALGRLGVEGLRRHPADYMYALAIARGELAQRGGDRGRALRWLNRALYLNPTYGPSHRLTARVLWAMGAREQAFDEWRRAMELHHEKNALVRDLIALDASYPSLRRGVTSDELLLLCRSLRQARRTGEADRCLEDRLASAPDDPRALATGFEWALGRSDLEAAEQLAQRMVKVQPADARGHVALGQLAARRGDEAAADRIWRAAIERVRDPSPLWIALFESARKRQQFSEARQHLEAYRRSAPGRDGLLYGLYLSGLLYEQQRLPAKALREFERAHVLQPDQANLIAGMARCQEQLGHLSQALDSYRRWHDLAPADPTPTAAIEKLEQKLEQRPLLLLEQASGRDR
ncbi:MAG: O-antigen ligase family protein [Deltaproteobacteria bacterium]|nr:O-antigen ligase family protein [Deltaproteobacteria bacterium]